MSVMHMGTTLHQFGCMTNRQSEDDEENSKSKQDDDKICD